MAIRECTGEAEYLADLIAGWIRNEKVPLSEIAVLVSKQLDLYANHLMTALEVREYRTGTSRRCRILLLNLPRGSLLTICPASTASESPKLGFGL